MTASINAETRFAPGDIPWHQDEVFPGEHTRQSGARRPRERMVSSEARQIRPDRMARLMAQKPWIVPIPGAAQMAHMLENIGSPALQFSRSELAELNASLASIKVQGARLPDAVQVYSDVEAPAKT